MAATVLVKLLGDTKDLQKKLDGGQSLVSGFASKAGLALKAGAAGAAVLFGKGFVDALGRERLGDQIGAQLGLDSAQQQAFIRDAADVYKQAWGDSIEQVAGVMAQATQAGFGGNFGDDIEGITERAFALADAFGTDVTETIQVASELADSLGISGVEAMDGLAVAFQRLPEAARDELGDAAKEYGGFMQQLGFDARETLGFFTHFGEQGAMALDKAGDALKELTIRGTDMSKASTEAFEAAGLSADDMGAALLGGGAGARRAVQDITLGLMSIKDPAAQAQAAIALFGTPLEDLGTAEIPEFLKQLGNMSDEFSLTEGAAQDLADEIGGNVLTRFEALKREGMEKVTRFMEDHALPAFLRFEGWFRTKWPNIKKVAVDVAERLQQAWAVAVDWFQTTGMPVLTRVFDAYVAYLGWWRDRFIEHWPAIQAAIQKFADWALRVAWPKIQETFVKVRGVVEDVVGFVEDHWPEVEAAFRKVVEEIVDLVEEHWPQIQETIEDTIDTIRAAVDLGMRVVRRLWNNYGREIVDLTRTWWTSIRNQIRGALDIVQGVVRSFGAIIKGDWGALWDAVKQILSGAWTAIKAIAQLQLEALKLLIKLQWDGIKAAAGLAWDGIKALIGLAWEGIKQLPGLALAGIVAAAKGIWDAVKSGASTGMALVVSTVSSFIASIPGTIAGFGLTVWTAAYTLAGQIWRGVRDGVAFVIREVSDAIGGVISYLSSPTLRSDLFTWASSAFGGLVSGISSVISAIPGMVADMILGPLDDIWDKIKGIVSSIAGAVIGDGSGGDDVNPPPVGGPCPEGQYMTTAGFCDWLPGYIPPGGGGGGTSPGGGGAHAGGVITPAGVSQPGLGADEVWRKLQVGETVTAKHEGGGGGPLVGTLIVQNNRSIEQELALVMALHGGSG